MLVTWERMLGEELQDLAIALYWRERVLAPWWCV